MCYCVLVFPSGLSFPSEILPWLLCVSVNLVKKIKKKSAGPRNRDNNGRITIFQNVLSLAFQVIQELKSVSPLIIVNANTECRCWAHRVGGEKVLLLSAAAWGSMTAFTPILAHFCSQPILSMTLSRFLMGLLQGETNSSVTHTSHMHVFVSC